METEAETKSEKVDFPIYFEDLTDIAQHYLLKQFNTTKEDENWEDTPLFILEREMEEE